MNFYQNDHFSLIVANKSVATDIIMKVKEGHLTTKSLPATKALLMQYLPAIMRSKCVNEKNYAFATEVKNTEIGHLFEHIVLVNLCALKMEEGVKNPIYNGLTSWNWKKEETGVFHISIDSGKKDSMLMDVALKQSIPLLLDILNCDLQMINSYKSNLEFLHHSPIYTEG